MTETGSDNQMTPEQREELEHRSDLQEAEELEEERKTEAAPATDDGLPAAT